MKGHLKKIIPSFMFALRPSLLSLPSGSSTIFVNLVQGPTVEGSYIHLQHSRRTYLPIEVVNVTFLEIEVLKLHVAGSKVGTTASVCGQGSLPFLGGEKKIRQRTKWEK